MLVEPPAAPATGAQGAAASPLGGQAAAAPRAARAPPPSPAALPAAPATDGRAAAAGATGTPLPTASTAAGAAPPTLRRPTQGAQAQPPPAAAGPRGQGAVASPALPRPPPPPLEALFPNAVPAVRPLPGAGAAPLAGARPSPLDRLPPDAAALDSLLRAAVRLPPPAGAPATVPAQQPAAALPHAPAPPPQPPPPMPPPPRGELGLEALLLAAAAPWGTPLEYYLANYAAPGRQFNPLFSGMVLLVDWPRVGHQRVWIVPASRAALDPALRGVSTQAQAAHTFALFFTGVTDGVALPDTGCVAWAHAPAPAPPGAVRTPHALRNAWGLDKLRQATAWVANAVTHSPLLPPLRTVLARYRDIALRVSEEEAKEGHAVCRSERSLLNRAAAFMMLTAARDQMHATGASALPGALRRRLASKTMVALLCPSLRPPKPPWWDLEALCEKAGWQRLTRADVTLPFPYRPPQPGELRQVDPNALLQAYTDTLGGAIPDDSVVYTICQHVSGHTPQLAPHLVQALADARARGGPLVLYDVDHLEPAPPPREAAAHWQQVERLAAQRTLLELSDEDLKNPRLCLALGWMGCVFKGPLTVSPDEAAAIASGDTAAISLAAEARARATLAELEQRLGAAPPATPPSQQPPPEPPPSAHPGFALEALLASHCASFSKTRPVARMQSFSRGNRRLGLAAGGIVPSGFTYPSLAEMLQGATTSSTIVRVDCRDWFYCLPYSPEGSALCCLTTRDPTGKLRHFSLQSLCMGISDSPCMAEAVTSLFCAIANARGCAAGGNQGFSAMCDDMVYLGPQHDAERAVDVLSTLLVKVGATEALDKRLVGPAGEVLGKLFDMPSGSVSLAPQRLHKYFANLELARLALSSPSAAIRAEITPTFLSKLVGTLAWLAETSISGATHLSGLYSVTAGTNSVESNLAAVLRDLSWWSAAARSGRVSAALLLHHDLPTFEVATDASDVALGAVSGRNAVWRTLSVRERTMSSARRELRAFIMALEVYGPTWSGGHLMIQSDSLSGALAFNRGRIRGDGGQADVERCYELMEQHNVHAVCAYLPREFNLVADSLSKVATTVKARAWARRRGINATIHWEWRAAQEAGDLPAPPAHASSPPATTTPQ